MEEGSKEHIEYLERLTGDQQTKINELSNYTSSAINNQAQDTNLIVWQLELDNILEKIEHLLKGDVVKVDGEGNVSFEKPDDDSLIILNEYGVQLVMNTVSFYLNRNTILSRYDSTRIYEILFDLGNELADVIYINYEQMGMTTMEKKSRHELLIINILHTLESCYNRALSGGERDSLRSSRFVTQNATPTVGSIQSTPGRRHMGGFLNPKNWKV